MWNGHNRLRDGIENSDCSGWGAANETWRRLAGRTRRGGRVLTMVKGTVKAFATIMAVCATVVKLPKYNYTTYK